MKFVWIGLTAFLLTTHLVHAQAPPPPPQPPGFDPSQEFEELDDDSLDMSNDPGAFRPPNFNGTPPPASTQNTPPPPDTSPSDHTAFGQTTGKVRFQVVEGEFYEKGKKRTRGKLH